MPNWLLFIVPSLIWGTTWLVIKSQLGTVAPEVSVVYRFALASLVLFAWCGVRGVSLRFSRRQHAGFLLLVAWNMLGARRGVPCSACCSYCAAVFGCFANGNG